MRRFNIPYVKTVWGILTVEARDERAVKQGEYDEIEEYENKSDYVLDEENTEEVI